MQGHMNVKHITDCMTYTYCCVYSTRLLMIDKKTSPKHVEFYSKNIFEKLVHVVGFIIRMYHDARSHECQTHNRPYEAESLKGNWPSYSQQNVNRRSGVML
jgi:hypothetical protein